MSKIERRYVPTELRINRDADSPIIEGYGAVFNTLSKDLGGFRETIDPGTFAKTIKEADIRSLYNHNMDLVLGRKSSGTLELKEDNIGLYFRATPPDTGYARDLIALIERGDVSDSSFGFRAIVDDWQIEGEDNIRTLKEVALFDTGPVTFPAYPGTTVAVRSAIMEAGIDMEAFNRVMVRHARKLELTEKDIEFIKEIRCVFNEINPPPPDNPDDNAPPQKRHAENRDTFDTAKMARRKRELDLMEIEI